MENKAIIELKEISFTFGTESVLENINLALKEKDFLGIIGPNGGGKTTLLKIILGLLKPDKGTIRVFGKSPEEGRKSIGYLPQHFSFDYDFPITVLEVVLMARLGKKGIWKKYSEADIKICLESLKKVGMEELKNRQMGSLSIGQTQRVFIARALATEPQLLLLDEPVSNLDPKWQASFHQLLEELNKNMAIVMVTHDVGVIVAHINKIACVNRRLYYHGSTKEGIKEISKMYQCPVELIGNDISHRISGAC